MRPASSWATPSAANVPRSPPDPFTSRTSVADPVTGSSTSTLTDVLPPPKFVKLGSDPRTCDRPRRASTAASSVVTRTDATLADVPIVPDTKNWTTTFVQEGSDSDPSCTKVEESKLYRDVDG